MSDTYFQDDWPKLPNGSDFDGRQLLTLVHNGTSPFREGWDVNLLIKEAEEALDAHVVDIPFVYNGSNNYGFHLKLSDGRNIIARLARGDVNMPDFDGFPIQVQISDVQFEAAVYELLRPEPGILASHLLYHRVPQQHDDNARLHRPQDIVGRRLLVFGKAEGESDVWRNLSSEQKAARIRASLFNFRVPLDFATEWLRERLFEQKPKSLPVPIAPTREFCIALFTAKIEATIRNIGDMIGWEDDNNTVDPIAFAAKQSLLRLIPHIMPGDGDQDSLYRLVLDHGDFGVHNMSITMDADSQPLITSLFDWETACIVPAILSDPLMAVTVDLVTDEDAAAAIIRVPENASRSDHERYMAWARQYLEVVLDRAPNYKRAIQAGKDARHLWFALRDWRGDDPERYFDDLGTWAETRMGELIK